jgi:hypothetical protein
LIARLTSTLRPSRRVILLSSLRVVIRYLSQPRAGGALAALADLLGGVDEKKREVAALAIQAVASDDHPGPGRAVVDAALVQELLPRMVAIAAKKVREDGRGGGGERGRAIDAPSAPIRTVLTPPFLSLLSIPPFRNLSTR